MILVLVAAYLFAAVGLVALWLGYHTIRLAFIGTGLIVVGFGFAIALVATIRLSHPSTRMED